MFHKKVFFTISILASIAATELRGQKTLFGLRAGVNLSTFAGNSDVTSIPGYHVGFLVEKKLGSHLVFQPNLMFSTLGAKEKASDKTKYVYQYIDLQLNFRSELSERLGLVYGPHFNTLVNALRRNDDGENEVVTSNVTTIDFALSLGLDVKISENISLVGAYNLGLLNNPFPLSEDSPHQNSSLQFSVIYLFRPKSQ